MEMSLSNVVTGPLERPVRMVLNGVEGVGKSTFGAGAPAPIFLAAEDGTHHLDVARFPTPSNWADCMAALGALYNEEHEYKTLVVDPLGWLEGVAEAQVCHDENVTGLEKIAYGKGHMFVFDLMRRFVQGLDALYMARSLNVLVITHTEVQTFKNPAGDDYDRYSIKAGKRTAAHFREWCDVLAFAKYDESVLKDDKKLGARAKGKSFRRREMHLSHSAAWDAKNRYNLPDVLPLAWSELEAAIAASRGEDSAA